MIYDDPKSRACEYAKRRGLTLGEVLGFGQDGIVLATDLATAVKSFKYKPLYEKELAVYLRLQARHVNRLCGFSVPSLINYHPELEIIEIEFVTPPFVLDFASAGVDQNPLSKYDPEQIAEFFEAWEELFGDDWPRVKQLYYAMRSHGIFLADLHPNNIRVRAATT